MADKALPSLGGLHISPKLQSDTIHIPVNYCCLYLDICGYCCGTGPPHWNWCYGRFSTGLKTEGGSPICPLFVRMARDGRTGQRAWLHTQEMCPSQPGTCCRAGSCNYPCPWESCFGGAGDDVMTEQHITH